jgi:hypothetical protein
MPTAIFTVTCPKSNEVVKQYELEYDTMDGLYDTFVVSRQVWDEYLVTVDTEDSELSSSHTWREEFLSTLV